MNISFEEFVEKANEEKSIYSAGPASLLEENIQFLQPCFGRGDKLYLEAEEFVLNYLSELTTHKNVVRLQGSATLALEIALLNFCRGRLLIIDTGYYSDRLKKISEKICLHNGSKVTSISHKEIQNISNNNYDWIIACYTETSIGLKLNIDESQFNKMWDNYLNPSHRLQQQKSNIRKIYSSENNKVDKDGGPYFFDMNELEKK